MFGKSATIQDVARISGVSTATVSRALSQPERVSQATRSLVLDAVRETGYQANQAARTLRRQRSGAVLALVPNMANPFFSAILSGLGAALAAEGHVLLIADTRTEGQTEQAEGAALPADPAAQLRDYLASGKADGAVIFDGSLDLGPVPAGPRPPLLMACEWGVAGLPSVQVDNAGGAGLAIDYLLAMGHRRIGHLCGPTGNVLTSSRLEGTRAALARAGLELAHLFEGDFSMDSGARAAAEWLALEQRPTAVFCASDAMACGFIGALAQAGISVPRDVSVIGFDDIDVASYMVPALTTVHQPRRLIGERAAQRILQMLEPGNAARGSADPGADLEDELLDVQLIPRQSVAPPAG